MDPIAMIDAFLTSYGERGVFTATEVTDLLLDLRSALSEANELEVALSN